jgi:hypothetical protein
VGFYYLWKKEGYRIMKFRLYYRGKLKSNQGKGDKIKHKQEIRRDFHFQLSRLWSIDKFLRDNINQPSFLIKRGSFNYLPIVCSEFSTISELNILFLRPEKPGNVFGDIDNRIKTLIDSLRIPKNSEIPKGDSPKENENPFYCLLEDDSLVSRFSVSTDHFLDWKDEYEVLVIITVNVKKTKSDISNADFV